MSSMVLRTNNATEFIKNNFSIFFRSANGIINQVSCSYTFQQNGVAKMKYGQAH